MFLQRRSFRRGFSATAVVWILVLWLAVPATRQASACWNVVLRECFDETPLILCSGNPTWPFQSPQFSGRYWRHFTNNSSTAWGFQSRYQDLHMCFSDYRALWCVGCPPSNDPEFDHYIPNLNTAVTYGAINLATAQVARVSFYLYNLSESLHDSIFWGASLTADLSGSVYWAGGYSGDMLSGWESRTIDMARLRDYTTSDSVSLLGQTTVYAYWYFHSDGNSVVDVGAFIDNITVSWDDGGVDLVAQSLTMNHAADSSVVVEPHLDDEVFTEFAFRTCSGGTDDYPPFHVLGRLDTTTLIDTLFHDLPSDCTVTFQTQRWWLTAGQHHLQFDVDAGNTVTETNENNNSKSLDFYVSPAPAQTVFIWITPGDDTLRADSTAVLRWAAYNADGQPSMGFYFDNDTIGCSGGLFGGTHVVTQGPDSLVWNTRIQVNGRVYYPYVQIFDPGGTVCQYAPKPVLIRHIGAVTVRPFSAIPEQAFLEQNYPNPFNPTTEIRYGLAKGGDVSLKIYDLLGRERASLIHAPQAPGTYTVVFDGGTLPTGIYLYTLTTPEGTLNRKMMLIK
jgi:hypothetical protein